MTDKEDRSVRVQVEGDAEASEAEEDTREDGAEEAEEPADSTGADEEKEQAQQEPEDEQEKDWKALYEDEHDRRLRAVAELQNYRRRSSERQAQQRKFANESILSDLLGVLDNFDQALCSLDEQDCSAETILQGVEMIHRQLADLAGRHGVTEIEAEGSRFDPNYHEAIERVETDEVPEMTIVEVASPGYMLHDRVLRPARVRVAVSPDADQQ